jgi:hypothetical protein
MNVKIMSRGGAVSQLLSVAAVIYCKTRYAIKCEIVYENHQMIHTKGFVVNNLLSSDETLTIVEPPFRSPIVSGRILSKFPKKLHKLLTPAQSLYRYALGLKAKYSFEIKKSEFRQVLKERIPNERGILDRVTPDTQLIDATYSAEYIFYTAEELSARFDISNLINPFNLLEDIPKICVHLRLGDMRTIPRWVQSHGVINPNSISKILSSMGVDVQHSQDILVISDEPTIAEVLLQQFGFSNWIVRDSGNIWEDLKVMANSELFVGSFSTVSFVAAAIRRFHLKSPAFLPYNSRREKLHRSARNEYDNYFRAKYLPKEHSIHFI